MTTDDRGWDEGYVDATEDYARRRPLPVCTTFLAEHPDYARGYAAGRAAYEAARRVARAAARMYPANPREDR